ncbi:hypothetical protein [Conexibacter arvalis]|uniref:Uncharacterized protein n=1 Tax=Conexibacter arvalis TaxID=912552 RepID=A0A840IGS4_9ACTN|nr:hypothetical protein [Conexibacter arvalis]MBB4663150.1 hypothetical protein [Conexibacter arvalis]
MSVSARALAAAGAAALALAAAAPAAHAEVRYVYDAWMVAGVDYSSEEATESGKVTRAISAGMGVNGWFRGLRFIDGALLTQRMASGARFYGVGAELAYQNNDTSPPDITNCSTTAVKETFAGVLNPLRAVDPRAAPAAMGITPFSIATFDLNCAVNGAVLRLGARSHRSNDTGPGHLRLALTVPRGDLGDHVIRLRGRHTDRRLATCPGDFVPTQLRYCVSRIYVELTLFRTFASEDGDDRLAPVVPKQPKIERGARRARATARCPRGCRYRIRVFLPPRRGRGVIGRGFVRPAPSAAASSPLARAATVVATRAGRLPAGKAARTIAVAIPASKRAAILDDGGAVVEVTLSARGRRPVRSTFFAPATR